MAQDLRAMHLDSALIPARAVPACRRRACPPIMSPVPRCLPGPLPPPQVYERGRFIAKVQADGVMLATPTGSTAYNVAAGGSMVRAGQLPLALGELPISPFLHAWLLLRMPSCPPLACPAPYCRCTPMCPPSCLPRSAPTPSTSAPSSCQTTLSWRCASQRARAAAQVRPAAERGRVPPAREGKVPGQGEAGALAGWRGMARQR